MSYSEIEIEAYVALSMRMSRTFAVASDQLAVDSAGSAAVARYSPDNRKYLSLLASY